MFKKYKIESVISNGSNAIVYKIKINNKYYALRKEKIYKQDALIHKDNFKYNKILDNTHLSIYRIIYFNEFINKINNIHFTIIYNYSIEKCSFHQPLTNTVKNDLIRLKKYNELIKSKYCFNLITDLKDGSLKEILYQLSSNQIYSMILQILYALHLMHSNSFIHTDIHNTNILYKKTKLKKIKIFNNIIIPTFGYLYSLIDYEAVFSIKYNLSEDAIKNMAMINTKYENYMSFLCKVIHGECITIIKIINKILYKEDISTDDISNFLYTALSYEATKYYCLNINEPMKIIKYFYKLIYKKN